MQKLKPLDDRTRQKPTPPDSQSEAQVLALCARLFLETERLVRATRFRLEHPVYMEPHSHDDWLQLDLVCDCVGEWLADGPRHIHGLTATVFYPTEKHGYRIAPQDTAGDVLSLKIRVDPDWPEIKARIFPPLTQNIVGGGALLRVMQRLVQLPNTSQNRPPLLMVSLAEALCLWPGMGPQRMDVEGVWGGDSFDPNNDLAPILAKIRAQVAHPPKVEELAQQAHFSTRHFSRRFRESFGCTVHHYLTELRLERACELLLQERMTVTEVAEALGFASIHTFSRWFRQQTGVTPSSYAVSQFAL